MVAAGVGAALVVGGCGGGGPSGRPVPERPPATARPLAVYQQLGMYSGTEEFPAVISLSTLAGPADSTYVLLGLSLPNRALRFQRDGDGFLAEYEVAITFVRDGQRLLRVERKEPVRVVSFAETSRTDESIIFQTLVPVQPGTYPIEIEARDVVGTRGLSVRDTIRVPSYGAAGARISAPVFVYQAEGRSTQRVLPDLVVNPRHTVPYGAEPAQLYLEAYGVQDGQPLTLAVEDEQGTEVWRTEVTLVGGSSEIRHTVITIPAASLPIGRLWLEVSGDGLGVAPRRSPLLVTISEQWMVANFEEVLEFLAYIGSPAELDSLRNSPAGADRQAAWDRFWASRDPLPATPINEFREEFFQRVRTATEQFGEPGGRPGWQTERGEVYIVLGPPDQVLERDGNRAELGVVDAVEWIYESAPGGGLRLMFVDRTGFGRYELTPTSRSAFRNVTQRMRPQR